MCAAAHSWRSGGSTCTPPEITGVSSDILEFVTVGNKHNQPFQVLAMLVTTRKNTTTRMATKRPAAACLHSPSRRPLAMWYTKQPAARAQGQTPVSTHEPCPVKRAPNGRLIKHPVVSLLHLLPDQVFLSDRLSEHSYFTITTFQLCVWYIKVVYQKKLPPPPKVFINTKE